MGPIGGELQQQITATGDLSQAEQTMTATGTVPAVEAPVIAVIYGGGFQYVSVRDRGREEVFVTRADLHQASQEMAAQGEVDTSHRIRFVHYQNRQRMTGSARLAMKSTGHVYSKRSMMADRAVRETETRDQRDMKELVALLDLLDEEDAA